MARSGGPGQPRRQPGQSTLHDPAKLKAALYKAGMTQRTLAGHLGVTEGHVSHIVQGRMNLTPENLRITARVLRVPQRSLMRDQE